MQICIVNSITQNTHTHTHYLIYMQLFYYPVVLPTNAMSERKRERLRRNNNEAMDVWVTIQSKKTTKQTQILQMSKLSWSFTAKTFSF